MSWIIVLVHHQKRDYYADQLTEFRKNNKEMFLELIIFELAFVVSLVSRHDSSKLLQVHFHILLGGIATLLHLFYQVWGLIVMASTSFRTLAEQFSMFLHFFFHFFSPLRLCACSHFFYLSLYSYKSFVIIFCIACHDFKAIPVFFHNSCRSVMTSRIAFLLLNAICFVVASVCGSPSNAKKKLFSVVGCAPVKPSFGVRVGAHLTTALL